MRTLPHFMPAIVTPFTRSGDLDLAAHSANVRKMWDMGIHGVLIAGSTGEGPYLEPGERRRLVTVARESAPRAFVLCGIHAETTRTARAALAEAADGGADAALIATPTTLVRNRPDRIEAFFVEVADGAQLPTLMYSVPAVTGVEIAEATVAVLAERQGVVGMKDSGGDPVRAARLLRAVPAEFTLFAGATRAISLSVASGAHGAITASGNYAPRLVRDTVTAARRSVRAAEPLQSVLTELSRDIEQFGVSGVKYASRRIGFASGYARSPLASASPQVRSVVRRALDRAGLA